MLFLTVFLFYCLCLFVVINYLPNGLKDKLNLFIAIIGLVVVLITGTELVIGSHTIETQVVEIGNIRGSGYGSIKIEDINGSIYWGFGRPFYEINSTSVKLTYLPITKMIVSIEQSRNSEQNVMIYDGNAGISLVLVVIIIAGIIVAVYSRKRIYQYFKGRR